jgi:hypothetical protein
MVALGIRERLKRKVYAGGIFAVLLCGCESFCLNAEAIMHLRNWHNKRLREMCRVTMCQTFVHQITSVSLQKRTGVFSLGNYLGSCTLLWAGQEPLVQKAHAAVGDGASDCWRPRDDLRQVTRAPPSSTLAKRARKAPRPPSPNGLLSRSIARGGASL